MSDRESDCNVTFELSISEMMDALYLTSEVSGRKSLQTRPLLATPIPTSLFPSTLADFNQ